MVYCINPPVILTVSAKVNALLSESINESSFCDGLFDFSPVLT